MRSKGFTPLENTPTLKVGMKMCGKYFPQNVASFRKRALTGFTLIEVLIAMVILSIALLAITGMFITGVDGVSFGDRITSAVTLAQKKMEELTALDYSDPNLAGGGPEEIGAITRIWEVKQDNPLSGMATIRVSVSWRDKGNKQRNITLITMRAK